jgi:uncharacterized coiled-coil DUF342 family protein
MSDLRERAASILNGATGGRDSWSKWDREVFEVVDEAADEIAGLRVQLASASERVAELQYEAGMYHSLYDVATERLASARKALDAANEYFEDAAVSSAYSRRVIKEIRAAYVALKLTKQGK